MLPIKEQISSVYRNKSSITFAHVKVYGGFMCICGKKRKYSCFVGSNSLFYVLFSLTVIALTWKLSWHFVGNKNIKRMLFAEGFTSLAPVHNLRQKASAAWFWSGLSIYPAETQTPGSRTGFLLLVKSAITGTSNTIVRGEKSASLRECWEKCFLQERNRNENDYSRIKFINAC